MAYLEILQTFSISPRDKANHALLPSTRITLFDLIEKATSRARL